MRIAMVSPYDFPYPGGVTKHITNLAESFRRQGHQVRIIAASTQSVEQLPAHVIRVSRCVVPVPYSGSVARVSFSPRLARRVGQLLRREDFDIVHIHEPTTPTLPWAVAEQARRLSLQTALVGTFHAYRETPSLPYKFARSIFRRVVNHLDERIAVSRAARDYISAYFPGAYQIIPNGVDAALFGKPDLPRLPRFLDGLNILFVGRLEPRKGFRYLVEAYARVKELLPQARLLVVGPYRPEDCLPFKRQLRRLHLEDVHFLGYLSDEDLARYYQNSQVLCAPSIGFESFGMVLLEAMAAGIPIVAFDIEGYRSVMTHQAEGLLVARKDVSAPGNGPARARDSLALYMGSSGRSGLSVLSWCTGAETRER
jgi:phosphatidylinositol alpha-mannosyltransferase